VCEADPEKKGEIVALVVGAATSFSTSLGPGLPALEETLRATGAALPDRPESRARPALFACENDHAAVEVLAKSLAGKVHVVSCMVDRICTNRAVEFTPVAGSSDGSGGLGGGRHSVDVACEAYGGQVVVLSKPQEVAGPPFAGDHVLVPAATAEADYLLRRKLLLVNGSHTTLAFMALAQAVPNKKRGLGDGSGGGDGGRGGGGGGTRPGDDDQVVLINDKLTGRHASLPLVTQATGTPAQRRTMMCWAAARILLLLFEWDLEVHCSLLCFPLQHTRPKQVLDPNV
jgi:hypothetical protein